MAKKISNSRLKETAFSQYNLRDAYITDMSDYVAALRDCSLLSNYSLQVLVRIPAVDSEMRSNNIDEYSNFVNTEWIDTTESVIPLFNEYRQVLSEYGLTADGTNDFMLPLQVILPTKLYLPRDSRIILNERDCMDNKVAREWQVLGTMRKQLSNGMTYSNVANCVPARQTTYNTRDLGGPHTIWFDGYCHEKCMEIIKDIRAQGTIWFVNKPINRNESIRAIEATIFEQIPEFPEINEKLEIPYYYDTRSKHIIDSGIGFIAGEEFDIYDDNGNQVYIQIDEKGTKVPLILYVTEVNENGGISAFKLNVEKGFTILGSDGDMQIELVKDEDFPAVINLVTVSAVGDIYNESLEAQVIEKPKYLTAYRMNAVFISKKIVATVIN